MMLVLLLAASLTGTVSSADHRPIAGARVSIAHQNPAQTTTSDANGAFTFPSVTFPVTLDVAAPGFAPAHIVVTASPVAIVLVPATIAESVIVTSERAPDWHDPMTGGTVLSRGDLDQIPAVTPDELLHVVSGFSLYRRSSAVTANPTTNGVTMRGLSASGSSRGLVLFDDVPLNDGFGGWVTWTRLPEAAIARIDVDRGPAGDAFGSDALGGLIRLAPATGASPSAMGSFEGGSLGLRDVNASAGGRRGSLSFFGAANAFTSDGSIPLAPESQGAVDAPTDARWKSMFGHLQAGPAAHRFSLTAWGGDDHRGNGTVLQRNSSRGETVTGSFESIGDGFTVAARASYSPNWYQQTFSSVPPTRATEKLTSTQVIDTDTLRAVVEAGHGVPRGHLDAIASLSRATSAFTVTTPAPASTTSNLSDDDAAAAVEAAFAPAAAVTITTGARHEWRTAPSSTAATLGATVGHVSTAWNVARHLAVRGSAATSHRWPTLNELVRDFQVGSVLTKANPALLPEHAVSFDGGVSWERSRWSLSATAFQSVVSNAIANVTISQNGSSITRMRENAGEAHSHGVEADAETRVTSHLRFRLSTTMVSATFRQSLEPALEGNRLPQVPRVSLGFEADATLPHGVSGSLIAHAVSSQFDDDRNQYLLSAATQVDARVASRASRRWTVQLVVENLLNANIQTGKTPLVTLAPGRAIRLGATWTLK